MKYYSFLFAVLLMLSACSDDTLEPLVLSSDGIDEDMTIHGPGNNAQFQKVDVITFQPAGGFGGDGNVLNEGDFFPPGSNSFAKMQRTNGYLRFFLHTTGLPPGAYTVWWVIFNKPLTCAEPNAAGGLCGGIGPDDLFLPSTSVVWATGGIVRADGVGNFNDRLRVGEMRDETIILGSDLSSPLQYPLAAEVHLVIKYHGLPSRNPEILWAQTHTLLGNCDGEGGANSYDLPPPFGPYQCFDPQVAILPSKLEPI